MEIKDIMCKENNHNLNIITNTSHRRSMKLDESVYS